MKILAIESSCDETAAAVVEDGIKVLSSVVASQIEEHRLYGGVVPEIASRRHCESITAVVSQALSDASLSLDSIDAIGVTAAPGLIGALLVGVNFAKGLALAANQAARSGTSHPFPHCRKLFIKSGIKTAFSLPGCVRRTQSHHRGVDLHRLQSHWQNTG